MVGGRDKAPQDQSIPRGMASPRAVTGGAPAAQLKLMATPPPDAGAPADETPSAVTTPRPAPHALQWAEQMRAEVKMLPKKGNSLSLLCRETRSVFNSNHTLLDDFSREKTVQWAAGIYRSALSLHTKIDSSKTTLGLVLTDDVVETVLPGGPAFLAGLRKGDCIVTVGCPALLPFVSLTAPCSAIEPLSGSQVDGKQPRYEGTEKTSATLQKALSKTDRVGDKVEVKFVRDGKGYKAKMVRMAVERVQSIRDWMEVQSQNASHARSKFDEVAKRYSSDMLDGLIHILVEQQNFENMMYARIAEVRFHLHDSLCGLCG